MVQKTKIRILGGGFGGGLRLRRLVVVAYDLSEHAAAAWKRNSE